MRRRSRNCRRVNDSWNMYKASGVVEVPGPPLVSAMTESKTLSVPLMLKIKDDSGTGREEGE